MLAVAGCGGGAEDSAAVDAGGVPGGGGMLVWALPERPASLDPLYAETGSEQLVARSRLARYGR